MTLTNYAQELASLVKLAMNALGLAKIPRKLER